MRDFCDLRSNQFYVYFTETIDWYNSEFNYGTGIGTKKKGLNQPTIEDVPWFSWEKYENSTCGCFMYGILGYIRPLLGYWDDGLVGCSKVDDR
jgi:hypothetical protein